MTAIDPRHYLVDENAKPFVRDFRVDLTAPDVPIESTGRFVVAELKAPRNQKLIVKSVMPYAMARTNVDNAAQSVRMLTNAEAGGFFSFEPSVGGNSPFIIEADLNAMRAAAVPTNKDRVKANGWTHISDNPWFQAAGIWDNPMFSIAVSPDVTFRIIFTLLPLGSSSPLPNPFVIALPGVVPLPDKRVDFAGVVITGVSLSDQVYQTVFKEAESKGIGPA